ncbi:trigger factor [candidate division KSB1 bacterium]|nr:trigger factor [candidate division KSB1 bacterium]
MNYNITKQKNWHTVIDIAVPAEKIKPEMDLNFKTYQKNVKLGGFRKGKVPAPLVKKMFGKQIESDTFQPFISEAWKKVFEENKFEIINEPVVTNIQYAEADGLKFNIEFDVRPDFEVTGYDEMPVEKPVYEIKDKDVADTLSDLQQRNAMIYTVEGEAKEDHFLKVDLQELDSTGIPVIGKKYTDQQIWLSRDNEEITRQLVGIKVGEERKIILTPQQSEQEEESESIPQPQMFLVTVKEIKERKLPKLDDEFAKDLGSFKTLGELKKDIKEKLISQADTESKIQFNNALADELIKRMDIEIPPSMLENYLNAVVKDFKNKNKQSDKINDNQIREYYRTSAIRTIKWILIREKMIEQETISVNDEEVETKIKELESGNEHSQQYAKEIRENEETKQDLKNQLVEDKVYEFLANKAKIKKVKKSLNKNPDEQKVVTK